MATSMEVLARLSADVSGFKRGLGEAEDAVHHLERTTDDTSSRLGSVLSGLGRVGVAAFAAIGAAGAAGVGWGIKVAMDAETAQVGFETMLGSAKQAEAFLDDLGKFAATTPFEFPELRSAASRLLAVGTEADAVIPLMTRLGDATAAMGTGSEGINRAVTALTQMQQKGKATGEEMLQLAEAGIPAWDALASSLGLSVAETQKLVSEGKVSADQVFAAIESGAGDAMQKVTGMMEAQSLTLQGLMSTLKDTVGMALGDMMGPAIESVKGALPAFTEAIGSALEAIGPQVTVMATGLVDLVSSLLPVFVPLVGSLAELLGSAFSALTPLIEGLTPVIGALAPFIDALAVGFEYVGEAMGNVAAVLSGALVGILQALTPLIEPIAAIIAVLAAAFSDALLPIIEAVTPILEEVATMIGGLLMEAIDVLTPAIRDIVDAFRDMKPSLEQIGGAFMQVLKAVAPVIPMIAQLIAKVVSGLAPVLPPLASAIASVASALATMLAGALSQILPPLMQMASTIISALMPVLPQLVGAILSVVEAFMPLIPPLLEIVTALLPPLTELISALAPVMADLVGILADGLVVAVEALAPILVLVAEGLGLIAGVLGEVIGFAATLVGGITNLGGVWETITGAMSSAWSTTWNGIKTVFEPIWNGIKAAIETLTGVFTRVWDTVKGVVSGAMDGIKGIIDRVFGVIKTIVDSVYDKFKAVFDRIKEIVSGVFDGLADAFKGAINAVLAGIEDGLNFAIDGLNVALDGVDKAAGPWVNFGEIPYVSLPRLAEGGLTTGSMIAQIGEAGEEAVLPLTNAKAMGRIGKAIAMNMPGGTGTLLAPDGLVASINALEILDQLAYQFSVDAETLNTRMQTLIARTKEQTAGVTDQTGKVQKATEQAKQMGSSVDGLTSGFRKGIEAGNALTTSFKNATTQLNAATTSTNNATSATKAFDTALVSLIKRLKDAADAANDSGSSSSGGGGSGGSSGSGNKPSGSGVLPSESAFGSLKPPIGGKPSGGISSGVSLYGALAGGGPVMGGRAYLVGEMGPELFVPGRSGSVLANGSGMTLETTVNVTVNGGNADEVRRTVQEAVNAALLDVVAEMRAR